MVGMRTTITRREWAASLAVSAVPAAAQEPASQQKPAPEELLAQAKSGVLESAEKLQKFRLPMATEPAFLFKP